MAIPDPAHGIATINSPFGSTWSFPNAPPLPPTITVSRKLLLGLRDLTMDEDKDNLCAIRLVLDALLGPA